jgi:hypothetical protein
LGTHTCDQIFAADAGHIHVQQHEINPAFAQALEHLDTVPGFGRHFHVATQAQEMAQASAQNGVIVGNHQADHGFS